MVRRLELDNGKLILKEDEIEGFLERTVTPIGTSGKADVPRRYIGQRVYVIITKNPGTLHEKGKK
jgi:putative transposon-encoded protein